MPKTMRRYEHVLKRQPKKVRAWGLIESLYTLALEGRWCVHVCVHVCLCVRFSQIGWKEEARSG